MTRRVALERNTAQKDFCALLRSLAYRIASILDDPGEKLIIGELQNTDGLKKKYGCLRLGVLG